MTALLFVLYLLAVVCFLLAAFRVVAPRVDFLSLGLAFFTVAPLLQVLQKL